MKHLNYTSVERVFSKIVRDLGHDQFSETDVIEWVGDALDAMKAVDILEEAIAFVEVKNHQACMPRFANSIIQIARNNEWSLENREGCTTAALLEQLTIPSQEDCPPCNRELGCQDVRYIPVDSLGNPIFEEDRYEYRPNINVLAEYIDWVRCDAFRRKWSPVRLKNHTFFDSLVCRETGIDTDGLYTNNSGRVRNIEDEYTIVGYDRNNPGNTTLRFSFREGFVAIAYLRQHLDDRGYPLVPDSYSHLTAITYYVIFRLMSRDYYAGRQGAKDRMKEAESQWQWYVKQAGNESIMPQGIDGLQNILEQRHYLLPRIHRYNQFFSGMSRRERRIYNDPDARNQHNFASREYRYGDNRW